MKHYPLITFLFLLVQHTSLNAQVYDLLGDQSSVCIPFTYEANFILVRVELEGLPLTFIFDTGAEHTLLFKKSIFQIVGGQAERTIRLFGSDLHQELYAHVARNMKFRLAPSRAVNLDLLVMDDDYTLIDEMIGRPVDGILGAQFFRQHIVKIDYRKHMITLYPHDEFTLPGKKFLAYDIQLRHNKPYISAVSKINQIDSAEINLLVDTGAGIGLILHTNSHEKLILPAQYITTSLGMGIGGHIRGFLGRIEQLTIQDISLHGVITGFQHVDTTQLSRDRIYRNGILGNQILSRFTIILDLTNEKLYLKPEKNLNSRFVYDRSGLSLAATGPNLNQYVVVYVIPGSPADSAGMQIGDQLQTLNRKPTRLMHLDNISRILRKKVGKSIRLTYRRGSEKHVTNFKLRDLI